MGLSRLDKILLTCIAISVIATLGYLQAQAESPVRPEAQEEAIPQTDAAQDCVQVRQSAMQLPARFQYDFLAKFGCLTNSDLAEERRRQRLDDTFRDYELERQKLRLDELERNGHCRSSFLIGC